MTTRKEVLELLSAGEISVEEATELLNAAGETPSPAALPAPAPVADADKPKRKGKGRWLRIQVSDLESGKARVRVNVPLALVNVGLKLGARFTDEIDAELIDDLLATVQDDAVTGSLVEVEDIEDNERVVIFVD